MTKLDVLLVLTALAGVGCDRPAPTPRPTLSRDADGVLVGTFDASMTTWLASRELPPPDPPVAAIEAGIAESLGEAMGAVDSAATAGAWGRLAMIFDYIRYVDLATAGYERAAALDPTDHRWPHLLGRVAEAAGDPAEAERRFRTAIDLRPDFAPTHARLGWILARQGRTGEARAALAKVIALDPRNPYPHAELGRLALAAGRGDEARGHLLRALERDPVDGQAHALLSRAYAEAGDEDAAARHRARAGPARPKDGLFRDPLARECREASGALLNDRRLAKRMWAKADFEGLVGVLERIVDRDSSYVNSMLDLVKVYETVGRPADATALLNTTLARHPDDPGVYEVAARVALTRRDAAAGLAWTDRALALDADQAAAHALRGAALAELGRLDEAIASAERAVALAPDDSVTAARLDQWRASATRREGRTHSRDR